jgi:hypothetical protein
MVGAVSFVEHAFKGKRDVLTRIWALFEGNAKSSQLIDSLNLVIRPTHRQG